MKIVDNPLAALSLGLVLLTIFLNPSSMGVAVFTVFNIVGLVMAIAGVILFTVAVAKEDSDKRADKQLANLTLKLSIILFILAPVIAGLQYVLP